MLFLSLICFKVEDENHELVDGSLIDLCGATLLWRSAEGIAKGPVCVFEPRQ